jgi:cyclic beta-1,2-glucan synthetase
MPQNTHLELMGAEAERLAEFAHEDCNFQLLREKAADLACSLTPLPEVTSSSVLRDRCRALKRDFKPLFADLETPPATSSVSDDFRWVYDNGRMLYSELQSTVTALRAETKLAHVRTPEGRTVPRVLVVADAFLETTSYEFSETEFTVFVETLQQTTVLTMRELWALVSALKLLLLEQIATRASRVVGSHPGESTGAGVYVRSLRNITEISWKEILEPLITFDYILRQDPAGCYAKMDFDSRDLYRRKLSNIAAHSNLSELEVAEEALALAEEAHRRRYENRRTAMRQSHIGYYLVDKGVRVLQERVGFRPSYSERIEASLRRYPDKFFLLGIGTLTCAIALAAGVLLYDPQNSLVLFLASILVLLLPSSQAAVQLMNHLTTSLLPPEILPKLDFSEAIPDDCITMVVVPSLLLNEKQVRGLVEDLEVRFLGNHDPKIHFALLTDLPDSRERASEDSPLTDLCADLIRELNERYAEQDMGSFFWFHRHRVYNQRERAWMGWERKRGKLLEFNKLLRGKSDSFPLKVGDVSFLRQVRFVITLDSDTELPRGTAHRMIGALAHPLNQAIIDPQTNIITAGYGILQPRVGVSVQSTALSRLAAIYAGETGLDIYTRAVSDAYQDLFAEGIFTGKGIYEVETVYRVLDRRFPANALLSHDLIEGAYARAGLVSDIEVIEDYPSHYSAYNRRKHRWLRGDWQIAGWLFPSVSDELGNRAPNPISSISRWKIFDNLRRSLVEPATFLLLVLGWIALEGKPLYWTLLTICILFVPAWTQFALNLSHSLLRRDALIAREGFDALYTAHVNLFFTLTFVAHQALLSLDAVIRALVRRMITHRRLLEWETAAEAELGSRGRAPADLYLHLMPALAIGLGLLVLVARPAALFAALPILLLWASGKLISEWLNRPSAPRTLISSKEIFFLRNAAVHTWRYFAQFSTEEHNWLIPDNIQEEPPAAAARVSPTNLGLLLNARQAAYEFGYITIPEFAEQTLRTLATISSLRKHRGHLLNWYDTRTLQPLAPFFVSSVDSGNLLASLWTLQQGCLERLRLPVLQRCLADGLVDNLRVIESFGTFPGEWLPICERDLRKDDWLQLLLELPEAAFDRIRGLVPGSKDAGSAPWFVEEAMARVQAIREAARDYTPWLLPEFAALRDDRFINLQLMDNAGLQETPDFIDQLANRLNVASHRLVSPGHKALCDRLSELLPQSRLRTARLINNLRLVAAEAGKLADEMDFEFLLNRRRKLMSVGFNVELKQLHPACYDLLGTESRTAVFAAIAKEDIPQESWFLLGRAHTLDGGRPVLLSWTGTLFEYLMPALWMRTYSNTLLERSRAAAVRAQQAYAGHKGVPWGISESAYFKLDEAGNYQYHAFGLPNLAMRKRELNGLVISPYSTFLALTVDPAGALRNLRRMADLHWFGSYGFYEAADYSSSRRRFWRPNSKLVRCWMTHHQGMSLLALANFLKGNVVQRWFHSNRRVQATELLLHEKPVAHVRRRDVPRRAAA